MDKLVIEGIEPYDGTYEFTFDGLTNRELHRIKKLTGLRVGEFGEAFAALDNDMVLAFAVIALERAGKHVEDSVLWDAPAGGIRIEFGEEVEEDVPPAQTGQPGSSGDDSQPTSDRPENGLSPTGSPLSDTGVTYAHPT